MRQSRDAWLERGVAMADDVDLSRIAADALIHRGCRIVGSETSIGPNSVIGAEAPVVLENCQLGRNVELKGGYFSGAVFFDGASMGSGAHVRPGTILEEAARGAHTVGLKQTILFPFVTLGSLINFCDILMAGGTRRKNHSEVGSSYVHFNYTPHRDKATASLVGDVPRGVFLDQKPIFLGGQGGLVGPARIAYGTVVAAGSVCRRDLEKENQLHIPEPPEPTTRPCEPGGYRKIDRIVESNLRYIGNIVALKQWYRHVRQPLMCRDEFDRACCAGGLWNLELILTERIRCLGELASTPGESSASQQSFRNAWPTMEFGLKQSDWVENTRAKEGFLAALESIPTGGAYAETIQSFDFEICKAGRAWLQSIVDEVVDAMLGVC